MRTAADVAHAVYPRPRGGAQVIRVRNVPRWGLSPPTRGSLAPVERQDPGVRSIPAHAGEP